jgi:hypothetical protein
MPRSKKRTAAEIKRDRGRHLEPIAYDVREFAHVCGLSARLLYELWKEGKGPPYTLIHRRRVIPRAGGEHWLASRVVS